ETTTLTAGSRECRDGQCTFSEASQLRLLPLGQKSCLQFEDPLNHTLGFLSIEVLAMQYRCNKESLFFTRDHELRARSIKLCAKNHGSCNYNRLKCNDIQYDSKPDELPDEVNDAPGYTYCREACGGFS